MIILEYCCALEVWGIYYVDKVPFPFFYFLLMWVDSQQGKQYLLLGSQSFMVGDLNMVYV